VVGLRRGEIEELAGREDIAKASVRDLAALAARAEPGATTVASTLFVAHSAGIRVLATGGIGGVHRGYESTLDVSADLTVLARTPVAVVCSGAKAVLDLPRTLEALETLGVPVVGYQTDELPGFYSRASGLRLDHRVDSPQEVARLLSAQWLSGLATGVVIGHAAPSASALPLTEVESMVEAAVRRAREEGVRGKEITPYLLDRLARESGGRTLEANIDLLIANAGLAARIAAAAAGIA
jgi:pseudouridine-5'-phosphate glycosidase